MGKIISELRVWQKKSFALTGTAKNIYSNMS